MIINQAIADELDFGQKRWLANINRSTYDISDLLNYGFSEIQ